ncbi:hypothetical protein COCCADRAFT_113420 [Bipolaris zeicola 26-R-13]|uniref:Cytochrome P450 n=1 Tax=Cochliobolus carbonum (strain 26-R-13) TaxID=930089 RepID=W6XVH2_COCC2|nr:uncharacterized protein COCCADRAFT_113420 [Bipolaris zeicola 26-R-13]EUC26774.1 hypothetical protein COCCADRAFT_113420 [Bipolaris zeicola 26-R-13]
MGSVHSSSPTFLVGALSTTVIVTFVGYIEFLFSNLKQKFLADQIVRQITIAIYRLFFHPYAKYPGPFLAKLTSWYSVYHTYVGDLHTDIWECHRKYGNLVRYAPNRLLINTEAAFKDIYAHDKNVQKSKSYLRISLVPGVHPTLGTLDNKDHSKFRRILNQGLSSSHIRKMDPELSSTAYLFAERLGEPQDRFSPSRQDNAGDGWTASKNMAEWCDFFTFDVMSKLVFGTSYDLLTSSENHWIVDGVSGQMRRVSFLMQLPELESMGLHHILFPQARRKALAFSKKSREIFEARQIRMHDKTNVDNLEENTDLFSKLLSARDPDTGQALSQQQLWAESNLLIIAGK